MNRSFTITVLLIFSAFTTGNVGNGALGDAPRGVIAEMESSTGAGFTRLAILGEDRIVLGTGDGAVWIWNPGLGERTELRPADSQGPPVLNLKPLGGRRILLRTGGLLEIGNPADTMQKLKLPEMELLEFSPTGEQMAGMDEPPLWFFSTETGKPTHRVDRQVLVDEIHYSPSGRLLATLRYGNLYLWNSQSGKMVWKARLETNFHGFAFTPDDKAIYAAASEGIWVVDATTGRVENRFSRSSSLEDDKSRHRLAFSPDGKLLAQTQLGNQIVIWETATGRPVLDGLKHSGEITDLGFLPEGLRLVSADDSGRAYVWDLSHASFAEPFDVTKPYNEEDLSKIWRMLGEPRGRSAWSAIVALRHRPEQALAMIDDPPNDERLIQELIFDLDHDSYSERQAAFRALKRLSLKAEPFLKSALKHSPSAEVTARIRRLLVYLSGPGREAQLKLLKESQNHRQLRLIQLLKWIGGDQARRRLRQLRDSASDPVIRTEAESALESINRPGGGP